MRKNEPYKIGRTHTPSEMPTLVNVKDIIVATMTCGGGFGGRCWEEYLDAVPIDSIPTNEMVTYTDAITGKKKTINTKYIVEVNEKQMLKVHSDLTEWRNYREKVCKKYYSERYIVLDRDEMWEFSMDNTKSDAKEIVRTDYYEE